MMKGYSGIKKEYVKWLLGPIQIRQHELMEGLFCTVIFLLFFFYSSLTIFEEERGLILLDT